MRKIVFVLLFITLLVTLSACSNNDETKDNGNATVQTKEVTESDVTATKEDETTSEEEITTTEASKLNEYINAAIAKLDELVNPAMDKIPDAELKNALKDYYDTERAYITAITDTDTAKEALSKVIEDTKVFAMNTLKPVAIEKLNGVINPLIEKITYEELKTSVQNYYNTEMEKINAVESLDQAADTYNEIIDDTKKFITDETEKVLIVLKNKALEELDPYVTALIEKIPYETLKTDTNSFYTKEKAKLEAVDTIEGVNPCALEIKEDMEEYALTETKKLAVSKLEELVNSGLERIPNQDLKSDLTEFSKEEIAKLNAIEKLDECASAIEAVTKETETHIKELLVSTVKEYISRLTAIENATAYDYLPEAMTPFYSKNLVSASDIAYDFTSDTKTSSINRAGYGEQWQMVIENINQSVSMAKVFNVAQTALSSAGNAIDIYLTNSYDDEMTYSFKENNYEGLFEFKDSELIFNLSLATEVTVAGFGSVKPVIKMEYDLIKEAKGMYISFGDAYKVKYVISDNSYEMATTYGVTIAGKSGSRSSYLSILKTDKKTEGHIYEYTTLTDSDLIKACADFYVENGYVSVVGNKSSGMTGFDGYINELYLADEGRLLGYEVREEMTVAGVKGTYNTLWFNLWDINGIDSIKVTDKSDSNKSGKSTVDVYLNGSTSLLSPTYNTKLGVKTSRKYDIEYRMRYYYTYDSENDVYVSNEIKVPMIFIQEGDNYNSFVSDMKNDNGLTVSVTLSSACLNKILSDYDTLIDVFITNKDSMSSEAIVEYLKKYE